MTPRAQVAAGLVLTAAAGWIDAIGYLRLGGLYTSLMSGNTTQLGIDLGDGAWLRALAPAMLVFLFCAGGFVGTGVGIAVAARWMIAAVLAVESVALATSLAIFLTTENVIPPTAILAFAMGVQNATLQHVQGYRAGTTFVTGALFGFAQKLALAVAGRAPRAAWRNDGLVWLALLVGATGGGIAHSLIGRLSLAIPVAVVAVATIVALAAAIGRPSDGQARASVPHPPRS